MRLSLAPRTRPLLARSQTRGPSPWLRSKVGNRTRVKGEKVRSKTRRSAGEAGGARGRRQHGDGVGGVAPDQKGSTAIGGQTSTELDVRALPRAAAGKPEGA